MHPDYLSALEERFCRVCGEPTQSVVLDTCELHDEPSWADDEDRARRAIRDLHALAVGEHARAVADLLLSLAKGARHAAH